ncbi:homoserine kinase [Bifidobacterium aemilianum]|uniref:Homoserine kinase n=1 Tax=Bifidobacterium aemilianum TaxID=2493120 RepID=A0A366K918_9BIFI|nr:homoserine kinase [Bifidobacterium aemilianum]RBP97658.1 homoserine kinase [Bifidobacterium aemilianum]
MKPICSQVTVRVPATSANLGSGFDSVGLALDYCDELTFTLGEEARTGVGSAGADGPDLTVVIHGEGEADLPRDETHLVVSTFRKACQTFGLDQLPLSLEACNRIPQARGMGSSAEAIVAGIAAAAAFAQPGELNRQAVFAMAAVIEGHPDNVAPAVFGGLTVSWNFQAAERVGSVPIPDGQPLSQGYQTVQYPVADSLTASVFVPDFELSTEAARHALPKTLPYQDAIANISRVGLLPAAMNPDFLATRADPNALLFAATQDMVHQPYRKELMPASWALVEAMRAGGFAAAISGAGPCVLVLHQGGDPALVRQLAQEELDSGHWRLLQLRVHPSGVQVERS